MIVAAAQLVACSAEQWGLSTEVQIPESRLEPAGAVARFAIAVDLTPEVFETPVAGSIVVVPTVYGEPPFTVTAAMWDDADPLLVSTVTIQGEGDTARSPGTSPGPGMGFGHDLAQKCGVEGDCTVDTTLELTLESGVAVTYGARVEAFVDAQREEARPDDARMTLAVSRLEPSGPVTLASASDPAGCAAVPVPTRWATLLAALLVVLRRLRGTSLHEHIEHG